MNSNGPGATHPPVASLDSDLAAHRLRPNAVSLRESVVIGIATSAPGQATTVALSAMVAVSAYASGPGILLSMAAMLAIALCYQRLNLWEQNCGGPYVWVAKTISPYVGFMVGWAMLVGFEFGAVSNILPLGPSLLSMFGVDASAKIASLVLATAFGFVLTIIAAVGIKMTARFQMALAGIEYLILLVFSCIAFWAVFIGHWPGTVRPGPGWLNPNGVGGRGSLAGAMLVGIFLFTGWDVSIYIGEETKRKQTNPGRAVLITVAILGPVYGWLFLCFQGVASSSKLASHAGVALPYVASVLVGSGWSKFMVVGIVLSVLGTTQATVLATSRVTYAMGTDQLLPRSFGRISQRFETPFWATMFWGCVMIVVADLYIGFASLANTFNDVVDGLAIAFAIFWIFTAVSTTVYYRKLLKRGARDLMLVGVIPLSGAAVLGWILVKTIPTLTSAGRWSLIAIATCGLVLMGVCSWVLKMPFFKIRRATFDA